MHRWPFLVLSIALASSGGCRCKPKAPAKPPPSLDQRLQRVQRAEWRRSSDRQGWLLKQLEASEPKLRRQAALAVGRIGLLAGSPQLVELLEKDPQPVVRRATLFALEALLLDAPLPLARHKSLLSALRARWRHERDHEVRAALLPTLGRVGDAAERQIIDSALSGPEAQSAALAWGLLARRGRLDRDASAALRPLLRANDARLRRLASWAVAGAAAGRGPTPVLPELLELGAKDKDMEVRAWAVRAIASEPKPSNHAEWLLARFAGRQMAVQVEAAAGLSRAGLWAAVKLTLELRKLWRELGGSHQRLTGPRLHAMLAGLRALEGMANVATIRQLADDLLELADASDAVVHYLPLQALAIDLVHCAAARLWDLGAGRLERSPTCGTARAPHLDAIGRRRHVVGVVAAMPRRDAVWRLLLLQRYFRDPAPQVRQSAVLALRSIPDVAIGAPLTRALDDTDLGVLEAAGRVVARQADHLRGLALAPRLARRLERLHPLREPAPTCALLQGLTPLRDRSVLPLLAQLRQSPARGVRRCADEAVRGIAGLVPPLPPPPSRGLPDLRWSRDPQAPLPRRAIMVTERGEIVLELLPDQAPATVATFARRAGRRAYRGGAILPRLPGELVEFGGRLDGYDEARYRLPCELSLEPFERADLGMILPAGRDSAGLRFFVALRRLPRFDGRATRFGRVVSGFSHLLALQPGERIKDLYIPAPKPPAAATSTPSTKKRLD